MHAIKAHDDPLTGPPSLAVDVDGFTPEPGLTNGRGPATVAGLVAAVRQAWDDARRR